MKIFFAKGFSLNEPVFFGFNEPKKLRGKRLDELTLTVTIQSQEDIDTMIGYLKEVKYCFDSPELKKQLS